MSSAVENADIVLELAAVTAPAVQKVLAQAKSVTNLESQNSFVDNVFGINTEFSGIESERNQEEKDEECRRSVYIATLADKSSANLNISHSVFNETMNL